MATKRICLIEGCGKPPRTRGWCSAHYQRWYKYGDPNITKKASPGEPRRFFEQRVLPYNGEECLIWPYQRGHMGYGFMYWDGRDQPVHRLACEVINGPPPTPKHDAAHNCGNGAGGCCAPNHVRWATRSENLMDRVIHGTDNRGEKAWNAKLTREDVTTIRRMRGKLSYSKMANRYGVTIGTIADAIHRRTWVWLE